MKKVLILCMAVLSLFVMSSAVLAASVMDKDVIWVGTESTFKPFEFRNEKNHIVGFDIDLINTIADKMGKKVEIVDMAFDALIPSLLTGKIDMIAAGMSATPERAKRVAFSDVYYTTPDAFTVKADRTDIASLDDLDGKKVSVQLGTIQDAFVSKRKGLEVKRYQKTDDAFREVLLGRVDVACVDGTVTKENLKNNKDYTDTLKVAFFHPISQTGMALAMSLEDPELKKNVNAALGEVLSGPAFQELKDKWGIE